MRKERASSSFCCHPKDAGKPACCHKNAHYPIALLSACSLYHRNPFPAYSHWLKISSRCQASKKDISGGYKKLAKIINISKCPCQREREQESWGAVIAVTHTHTLVQQ